MKIMEYIQGLMQNHPGKSLGALIGFVAGILFLTLGIKRTILIILFVLLGILIGNLIDSRVRITWPFKRKGRDSDHEM
jgi:uncharacterized membrane protein